MPSQAIAEANRQVEDETRTKKRGQYKRYSAEVRAEIGKYASFHGVAAAARRFSKNPVSETTVRSIKQAYMEQVKKKRRAEDEEDIVTLPSKKQGRAPMVQLYVKKVREGGGAVSSRIVMAAAQGIVLKCDQNMLQKFGGHVELTIHRAHSLLQCMHFVKRKATTCTVYLKK